MIRIQYDDGRSPKSDKDRHPLCTRNGRSSGYYVLLPDGTEQPLVIGYMRVSEMAALESILNNVLCSEEHASFAQVTGTGIPVRSRA